MTFPTPYQIPWFEYTGDPSVTDELGNTDDSWAAASVLVSVIGWDILTSEQLAEHAAEERFEVFLMTQPTFWPAIRDRVGLPLPENNFTAPAAIFNTDGSVQKGVFEVVGHDIENATFMLWNPGNINLMKRVEG